MKRLQTSTADARDVAARMAACVPGIRESQ
jgi:hypothetical protein